MKKKIIVLSVSKSVAEIDWILPLIYELKDDFKIFTLFQSQKAYKTLVKDKLLFDLWKEASPEYKIENIVEKTWRFLDHNIFYKFFSNKDLNPFIRFNIKNYFKKSKINFSEIVIFFTEFGTYSPYINYIKNEKERPKIIHFPTSAFIFTQQKLNENINYSLRGDYLFVCNDLDINFWSKKIEKKKIIVVGAPKYDSSWLNKIDCTKKIVNNKKPNILIAYSSRFQFEIEKNKKQLNDIMQVLECFKGYKIIFKIHPRKNHPYYLKILEKYKNLDIEVSNKNLLSLSKSCDIFLHDRNSSVIYDSLVFKNPTIEYWDTMNDLDNKIAPDYLKLNVKANNADELKRLIKLAADDPTNEIWENQQKSFKKNCKKFGENATSHCVNVVHRLLKD